LPRGRLVDLTVCLHSCEGTPAVNDFLLGFWNSRPVEHLLCRGLLARSCTWIPFGAIERLPFPVPDLVSRLDESRRPPEDDRLQLPPQRLRPDAVREALADDAQRMVWVVVAAAVDAERHRRTAIEIVEERFRENGADPKARVACWQAIAGRTAGGHTVHAPQLATLRADLGPLFGTELAGFERQVDILDVVVATLYGFRDAEYERLLSH
jgi:hypothetical protein